jgi:hypothetical protein
LVVLSTERIESCFGKWRVVMDTPPPGGLLESSS